MLLEGTVMNGRVELDEPAKLPDGTRVSVAPVEVHDYPHPMAPYDREKELSLLREAYAEIKAGKRGMPLAQFEAEFTKEFGISPLQSE